MYDFLLTCMESTRFSPMAQSWSVGYYHLTITKRVHTTPKEPIVRDQRCNKNGNLGKRRRIEPSFFCLHSINEWLTKNKEVMLVFFICTKLSFLPPNRLLQCVYYITKRICLHIHVMELINLHLLENYILLHTLYSFITSVLDIIKCV